MKVLFVCDSLAIGGAERQMTLLIKSLPQEWECLVWSLDDGPFVKEIRDQGIQVVICPRRWQWDLLPLGNLWRLVRQWNPDLIHTWGWVTNLTVFPIARILKIPLVNGIIRTGKPIYYRSRLTKFSSHFGDVVVSNSRAGLKNWGINPTKGKVIYNGFDKQRILKGAKLIDQRSNDKFVVVMAARMARAKDFALFISSLRKKVQEGEINWKFLAIGQGEHRDVLIAENSDLVLKGYLEFPDAGLDVIPFLLASNVGVLLTNSKYHEEGCSNTIMEYMACELPVIATDNGGNRELVEDNITGFVIPDSDIDSLLNKLVWFHHNRSEAKRFGEKGRERVINHFSIEKMVKSYVDLYKSLRDQSK